MLVPKSIVSFASAPSGRLLRHRESRLSALFFLIHGVLVYVLAVVTHETIARLSVLVSMLHSLRSY